MKLQHNILASYASQMYVAVIGIAVVPLLINTLGPESYGLVGFYSMLQSWFNLLDLGMSPSISRETSKYQGGATSSNDFWRLFRVLEAVFFVVALLGCFILFQGANSIAKLWLNFDSLALIDVVFSIQVMALVVSLRWSCGLYRGVIMGSQRLVWLSGHSIAIATFRFIVVLPVLMFFEATPKVFFMYQFCIAIVELGTLALYSYSILPRRTESDHKSWEWRSLKPILSFSLSIAFTSAVWVMVTQVDKLVLSGILDLDEYGYFSLAVLAANTILLLSTPVGMALMPKLTRLESDGKHEMLIQVYRTGTQLVALLAGSAAITVACMARPLLQVWTANEVLVDFASPVLALYAIGNGFLALSSFPYYMQYAKGRLSLHFIGNLFFVALHVPLIVWAANHYGAIGAGWVWLGMNTLTFIVWLPIVHHKFAPGLNRQWYTIDTVLPLLPAAIVGALAAAAIPETLSRPMLLLAVVTVGFSVFSAATAVLFFIRRRMNEPFLKWGD